MKKIKDKISNMKPKDWIMVSLWSLTLVFLFAFVGTVSGLNEKAHETIGHGVWKYKLTEHGVKQRDAGNITPKDKKPKEIYETKDEALKANPTVLSKDFNDKKAIWTFDKFENAAPSESAKKASNSIAAVAFVFFLSLTAAIFSTAFIKFKERKEGK